MSRACRLELAGPSNPTACSEGPNDASATGIRRWPNCGAANSALDLGERGEQLLAVTEASGDRRIADARIEVRVIVPISSTAGRPANSGWQRALRMIRWPWRTRLPARSLSAPDAIRAAKRLMQLPFSIGRRKSFSRSRWSKIDCLAVSTRRRLYGRTSNAGHLYSCPPATAQSVGPASDRGNPSDRRALEAGGRVRVYERPLGSSSALRGPAQEERSVVLGVGLDPANRRQ